MRKECRTAKFKTGAYYNILVLNGTGKYVKSKCLQTAPKHIFEINGRAETLGTFEISDTIEVAESLEYVAYADLTA